MEILWEGAVQRPVSSERLALESNDRESSRTSLYSHAGQSYAGKTLKWIVSAVEFTPED